MRLSGALVAAVILCGAARSVAAIAQPGWKQIGTTSVGNPVYLLAKSVKKAPDGIITATLRAVFIKGVKTPQGVITSSKTIAMFDCVKQTVAVKENTYYYDESRNRIYQHSAPKLPGFATTIRNTLADIALHYLCAPPAK